MNKIWKTGEFFGTKQNICRHFGRERRKSAQRNFNNTQILCRYAYPYGRSGRDGLVLLRRQSRAPYGAFRAYGRALRSRRLVYFQSSSLCFRSLGCRHGPYDITLYARVRSVLSAVHSLGFCRYRRKAAVRQCAFSYVYAGSGRHSLCHNMYAG